MGDSLIGHFQWLLTINNRIAGPIQPSLTAVALKLHLLAYDSQLLSQTRHSSFFVHPKAPQNFFDVDTVHSTYHIYPCFLLEILVLYLQVQVGCSFNYILVQSSTDRDHDVLNDNLPSWATWQIFFCNLLITRPVLLHTRRLFNYYDFVMPQIGHSLLVSQTIYQILFFLHFCPQATVCHSKSANQETFLNHWPHPFYFGYFDCHLDLRLN